MPLRKRKPTSPGRRFQTVSDFAEITKTKPEKSLHQAEAAAPAVATPTAARPSRHRGGGHKQQYRIVDFRANKDGVPAKVAAIEYDPNRNCRIALLHYLDGEKRYILAPHGPGGRRHAAERPGLRDPSRQRAAAALHPGRHRRCTTSSSSPARGGKMARGAGAAIQLVAKEGDVRHPAPARPPRCAACPIDCRATVGAVGNAEAELIKIGKAGRNRWKGKRPQTRGVAMNPVDHPLGGGEGKSSGGRHPVSPWGKPEGRTRKKGKASDKLIVRRRRTRGARR